ncbi:Serine acetyltransferase [subsurface metagenome]
MKVIEDFKAVFDRDPAAHGFWGVFNVILTYPGFQAICLHRIAHLLYGLHIPVVPHLIMWIERFLTGIEIHPNAKIGGGIFIDHGFGVVIGETSEIGNNATLFQGVTLGGTGKETGKRHPTVGDNVVIGAGAKVLGGITLGNNVFIGANAVVLKPVPDDCTVVGVPGRCIRVEGKRVESATLRHDLLPDPILSQLEKLQDEIESVEKNIHRWHLDENTGADDKDDNENEK